MKARRVADSPQTSKTETLRDIAGRSVTESNQKKSSGSYDFLEDRTVSGQKVRMLTVLDEYTRECLGIHVAPSFTGERVTRLLEWLFLVNGSPEYIRSDNGPEFICRHVREWIQGHQVKTLYTTPGSP